jgi:hypothetical protein
MSLQLSDMSSSATSAILWVGAIKGNVQECTGSFSKLMPNPSEHDHAKQYLQIDPTKISED